MTWSMIGWTILKIAIMVGVVVNGAAILTWYDRRGGALMQDRVGPNRAVVKVFGREFRLAGMLHPLADGLKFFFKEDFMPPRADKLLFSLAPILAMMPVMILVAVIPFGDTVCPYDFVHGAIVPRYGVCGTMVDAAHHTVWAPMQLVVAPLNVGLLFVFAMAGQGIVGAAIAGWSSDNKFSLMGAVRAASQMVSYEVAMGLSLIGALMLYGTIRMDDMVLWQGEHTWGIFVQPLAFFLFFAAVTAESKRIPFDLPEAESELVSGYFTEYSGMKFGMFYFAEYMEVITSSMLLVTIFLGGWEVPFLHRDGLTIAFGGRTFLHAGIAHWGMILIGVLAFFGKVGVLCLVQAQIRWSLPRFRYDQLQKLGWRVMLPLALANVLVTAVAYLAVDHAGPNVWDGLDVVAEITQAIVAVAVTYGILRAIIGFFRPQQHRPWIVGSEAALASAAGGTPTGPMQR